MSGPAQTSAQSFAAPKEDEATLLARDIALLIERLGIENSNSPTIKSAQYSMGERQCLIIRSQLEMDKNASVPDRTSRRWDSVRIVAYMQDTPAADAANRIPLFNAICTDRKAIAGAHPTAGLQKLPFEASPIAPGQWVHAVRSLASALRSADAVNINTHRPDARVRGPAWHSA